MKTVNRILFILHLFIGIGAAAGGFAAISEPYSPMGAPLEMLEHSPFDSFFIPGLILFGFIGLGNIACAVVTRVGEKYRGLFSGFMGSGLVVWIVVQCIMLRGVGALHVIFFILGGVQSVLALFLLYKEDMFPMNIVKDILRESGHFV